MNLRQTVRDLSGLPEKFLKGALEAILEQAGLVRDLAQVRVRVDTGSLRDSIRVERGGVGTHWAVVFVRAGGYVTNPRTGRLVDYAVIIELKYPYMRPSLEEVKPQINDVISRYCLMHVRDVEQHGVLRFS